MGLGELFVVFLMVMSMIVYFRIFHSKCLICFYVQIYSLSKGYWLTCWQALLFLSRIIRKTKLQCPPGKESWVIISQGMGISQAFISCPLIVHLLLCSFLCHPCSSSLFLFFAFFNCKTVISVILILILLLNHSINKYLCAVFVCQTLFLQRSPSLSDSFTRYRTITVNIFIDDCENSSENICLENPVIHRLNS